MATAKKVKAQPGPVASNPTAEFQARPDAMEALCSAIAGGDNLAEFCRREGLNYWSMRKWVEKPEREAMYARAREDRADKLADEIVAIADEVEVQSIATPDGAVEVRFDATAVARNRLRVDARKWVAAKLKPRAYGEKTTAEVQVSGNLQVQHVPDEALLAIIQKFQGKAE